MKNHTKEYCDCGFPQSKPPHEHCNPQGNTSWIDMVLKQGGALVINGMFPSEKLIAEVKWADGRITIVKADTLKQIVYLLEDKIFVERGE